MGNKLCKKKNLQPEEEYDVLVPKERRGSGEAAESDVYLPLPKSSSTKTLSAKSSKSSHKSKSSKSSKNSKKNLNLKIPKPFKKYLHDTEDVQWYLDREGILTKASEIEGSTDAEREKDKSEKELEERKKKEAEEQRKKDAIIAAEREKNIQLINHFLLLKQKVSDTTQRKYVYRELVPWKDNEMLELLKARMSEEQISFRSKPKHSKTSISKKSGKSELSVIKEKAPWNKYYNSTNRFLKITNEDAFSRYSEDKILQLNQFELKNGTIIRNICNNYGRNLSRCDKKPKKRFSEFEAQFRKSMFRSTDGDENCCTESCGSSSFICSSDLPCCTTTGSSSYSSTCDE